MFLLVYGVAKHFMARRGKISLTQINLKCADSLKIVRATNSKVFLYRFTLIKEESNPAAQETGQWMKSTIANHLQQCSRLLSVSREASIARKVGQ